MIFKNYLLNIFSIVAKFSEWMMAKMMALSDEMKVGWKSADAHRYYAPLPQVSSELLEDLAPYLHCDCVLCALLD